MKRFMIAAAAVILVFTLAGCGLVSELSNLKDEIESAKSELEAMMGEFQNMAVENQPDVTASEGDGKTVYEKDDAGHITKIYRYDGEGRLVFTHEQLWENDRLARKTSYNSAGEQTGSYDYKYDDNGNIIESCWYFWSNGILMKSEASYDENNRIIENTNLGSGNVSTNKTFYEYGEDGKLIKKIYHSHWPSDDPYISSYEYNEDGLLLKETRTRNGEMCDYTVYTYDGGKMAEYSSYDAEGKVNYTYKFTYDENGKKIREERYDSEGKLVSVSY